MEANLTEQPFIIWEYLLLYTGLFLVFVDNQKLEQKHYNPVLQLIEHSGRTLQLAKNEEILKDLEELRSKANAIEFKQKVSASLKTRYGKQGVLRIIGRVENTDATVLTCTVGSFRHVVVARPDGSDSHSRHQPGKRQQLVRESDSH